MAAPPKRATLADLMRHEGKVELIGGRLVEFMSVGRRHNKVAGRIFRSLDDFALARGVGEAYTDRMGFTVPELTSGRESFSPDASYHAGPFDPDDTRLVAAAPTFAVEVRSESDYGPAAERELAAKRGDYFEAGTPVVWDVCPRTREVRKYAPNQLTPTVFPLGTVADAEPAVPGWTMNVDAIFA